MVSTEGVAHPLDADSARWLDELNASGRPRESAVSELYALLLRIARSELHRRGTQTRLGSAEVDDLAHQATADALLAITAKLGQFRGESRFTTWPIASSSWRSPASSVVTSGVTHRPAWASRSGSASPTASVWNRVRSRSGAVSSTGCAVRSRANSPRISDASSWRSCSPAYPWTPSPYSWTPPATPSTRRCSTLGASCVPAWRPTGTWSRSNERLAAAGSLPADRSP